MSDEEEEAAFMESMMAAQAEAMDLMFCPAKNTSEGVTVHCDCVRDHEGPHTGMIPGTPFWRTWTPLSPLYTED